MKIGMITGADKGRLALPMSPSGTLRLSALVEYVGSSWRLSRPVTKTDELATRPHMDERSMQTRRPPYPLHGSMAYHYPPDVRKDEVVGALFGEPYRVARSGTAELEVPEGAEIVVEGKILNDVREPEGPFSESTGYTSYRSTENVFVAERVQMRHDAMLQSIASGTAADHILISCELHVRARS